MALPVGKGHSSCPVGVCKGRTGLHVGAWCRSRGQAVLPYIASCMSLWNLQTWINIEYPCHFVLPSSQSEDLLTIIGRDSVLLQFFYLTPENDPPRLASRDDTGNVRRLRRTSCTMRSDVTMKGPFPMQTKCDARQMKTAPGHASFPVWLSQTVTLGVKSYEDNESKMWAPNFFGSTRAFGWKLLGLRLAMRGGGDLGAL